MIAYVFSFLMIIYGLVSMAIGFREDNRMSWIGLCIFLFASVCLYISNMTIRSCNLLYILFIFGMLCNDYILIALCGVFFGEWWWYISLSSSLILLLIWCMVFNYHETRVKDNQSARVVQMVVSRPRTTFLEVE